MEAVTLLINGSHGQYCPKVFATNYDLTLWSGIDEDDRMTLLAGPDHPDYWEVWDDVLGNASFTHNGNTWTLVQDSDVWAICDAMMSNDEYLQWHGQMKPVPDNAYEYKVCGNCLIGLANDDYTGMSDAEERATKSGLRALHVEYDRVMPDGAGYGFSQHNCECCDALAGERYRVTCFDRKVVTT